MVDFSQVIDYNSQNRGVQVYSVMLGSIYCKFIVGNTRNSMLARIETVNLGKKQPDINNGFGFVNWPNGYDINLVSKASVLDSNPNNSRTVVLIVPPNHWPVFKERYRTVFSFNKP